MKDVPVTATAKFIPESPNVSTVISVHSLLWQWQSHYTDCTGLIPLTL